MCPKGTRYDSAGAAQYLNVAKQTMPNWRQKRKGPVYYRIGDKIYYFEEDLDKFIESGRVDPNAR